MEIRPTIRVLPPELASQIAAGEVVERPASVVKELVENSIDAGATRVHVEVESGGKTLIRVVDDGCGMTAEDVGLALQRHATSKLHSLSDLTRISSLGFRGEALPSVASVSRMKLTTRTSGAVAGTVCEVAPGAGVRLSETGCGIGTTVEVTDLFFNIPARLKFLKTERTESSHVAQTLLHLALCWPAVHFSLVEDGRRSMDLPAHGSLLERASMALSRRGAGDLHLAEHIDGQLEVEAALGPPTAAVATARNVYLLVNGRGVRDRLMLRMLTSGYGELLERGRYPVAVVHLKLPADEVDVNVHPQKQEVRFRDERRLASILHRAISEGVAGAPWAQVAGVGKTAGLPYRLRTAPGAASSGEGKGEGTRTGLGSGLAHGVGVGRREEGSLGGVASQTSPEYLRGHPVGWVGSGPLSAGRDPDLESAASSLEDMVPPESLRRCRYLGQVFGTYLLFEGERELCLLDQHAAHERVTYTRLREAMSCGGVQMQRLLFPAQVVLSPEEEDAVRSQAERLESCGFEVELLSGHSCAVRGVPALLADADPDALLRDVALELSSEDRSDTMERRWDRLAATLACHASVRGGQTLGAREVDALLRGLDKVERSGHCPHGRPVVVRLSETELRRRFGRE